MEKVCSQCGQKKSLKEFSRNSQAKNGIRSYCKECNRNYDLKRRYNIDVKLIDTMLIEQDGKCAICHTQFQNRKTTHLDHNHENGEIRQLLCRNCNHLIGNSNENIDILLSAIDYLSKWNKNQIID